MNFWKHYHLAISIEDALEAMSATDGPVCPIAGGTDLLLELQQSHHSPVDTLVDINRIPELGRLEMRGEQVYIGAAVPVSEIVRSAMIQKYAAAVAEACNLIGGPQVRNSATLGGNVAHALPAADGMISLVAMDAQAEIASSVGMRRVPVLELFLGPGKSSLVLGKEILVGFYLQKTQQHQASAFDRIMRPQGVALPILNMAIWLEREGSRIKNLRIAVGPAGPTPQRARTVEEALVGCEYSRDAAAQFRTIWRTSMHFRSSPSRATAEYRYQLAEVLFENVLDTAWLRSGSGGESHE